MNKMYPIVTLCGSTKFKDEFFHAQKELTLKGYIVIPVALFEYNKDTEVRNGKNEEDVRNTMMMLDDIDKSKIDIADEIYVVNPNGYIGERTWSEICYARMTDKPIKSMEHINESDIEQRIQKRIKEAEELAWQQLDGIRHSDGYYDIDNYVHFKHKGKIIVDPWINVETHYDGTPWADHSDPNMGVDPFKYYGKKKVARFIEEIVKR